MKKFFNEFKQFAVKGNAVDLAVGVIIGAAFGQIVNSLVNDVIMPPLGLLTGDVDFSEKIITLKEATAGASAVTLNYGNFLTVAVDFLIVAFAVFLLVRWINRLKAAPEKTPTTKKCPYCTTAISKKATRCPACTSKI